MLDPGTQLRQMVTSVAHTLRTNDPDEWKSLIQGPLPRRPRAGLEFPYLLRGALLPMRQMPQQVLSGPFPRHADHLHLLLAERVKTGEQLIENAAFLLDQH